MGGLPSSLTVSQPQASDGESQHPQRSAVRRDLRAARFAGATRARFVLRSRDSHAQRIAAACPNSPRARWLSTSKTSTASTARTSTAGGSLRRTKLSDRDQIRLFDVLLEFHAGAVPTGSRGHRPPPGRRHRASKKRSPLRGQPRSSIRSMLATNPGSTVGAQVKLRAVLEITRNLGQSLAVDVFLKNILDTMFQIFPQADRGYILLAEKPSGRLTPRAVKLETRRRERIAHARPDQPIGGPAGDGRGKGHSQHRCQGRRRRPGRRCLKSRSAR